MEKIIKTINIFIKRIVPKSDLIYSSIYCNKNLLQYMLHNIFLLTKLFELFRANQDDI